MRATRLPITGVLLAGVLVAGCGSTSDDSTTTAKSAAAPAKAKPFTVKSSLDGVRVLPHRIHWTATPSRPGSDVSTVEFTIDGKKVFEEKKAPYAFDEDGGWLVTSFLSPGPHHFGVRATATDGKTAEDDVKAEVPAAPTPPAALAGSWTRKVTDVSDSPTPGSPENPTDTYTPKGVYTLKFDKVEAQTRFPGKFQQPDSDQTGHGWIIDSDYVPGARTLRARGGVTKADPADEQAEGGWWCTNVGPESTYKWSVTGNTLTLEPDGGKDACGVRGFIWAGTWKRG